MSEYQNIKKFLQMATFKIGLKTFLWSQKLKILVDGHSLLVILKVQKLLECFTKKSYFPPDSHSKNKTKVELNLSKYATKSNLKTPQVLIYHNLLKKMI